MPMYSLHSIKTLETRRIKRFPAKTFTNVGLVQRVIKNRVRAPTHHTGNKSPDTRRGSLASLAIHKPCRSRFIAFKRLCIHCTQVNILRLQVTLKQSICMCIYIYAVTIYQRTVAVPMAVPSQNIVVWYSSPSTHGSILLPLYSRGMKRLLWGLG